MPSGYLYVCLTNPISVLCLGLASRSTESAEALLSIQWCALVLFDVISRIDNSSSADADAVNELKLFEDHPNDAEEPLRRVPKRERRWSGIMAQAA